MLLFIHLVNYSTMAEPERRKAEKRPINRQSTLVVHSGYDFDYALSRDDANELMTSKVISKCNFSS